MKKKTNIILLRCILAVLILANMTVIFLFSHQSGPESNKTSTDVSQAVAEVTVPDFEAKPKDEQTQIVKRINAPLRKLAHMTEFGTLGALVFLFLLTWHGRLLWRYGASLAFTLLYACSDEWHQSLTNARGPQITDALIDLSGAAITCTLILIIVFCIRKRKGLYPARMTTTHYSIPVQATVEPLRIAIASDLHGEPCEPVLARIREEQPNLILIPGDLMDDEMLADPQASGYIFLRECAKLAPTFYSFGNHEVACYHKGNPWRHPIPIRLSDDILGRIRATGAVLLDNTSFSMGDITLCGIGTGINGKKNEPDSQQLAAFAALPGYRILLCHHPEYFVPYIKDTDINLTVCGHAHGGQWRLFGRGVYAPGQGLFPKYTSGVVDDRCVISRGLGNHTVYPRLFNPREVVLLHLKPKQ